LGIDEGRKEARKEGREGGRKKGWRREVGRKDTKPIADIKDSNG
jgi:hypothetical protein